MSMDEEIGFRMSGTINIDGKKSIDDVSESIETSIKKLEKMEKTAKSVTETLAKMFKGVPTQNLKSKEQTEINNFAQRYRRREYENSYSQYRQRQNQSFGFTPITDQVSQRRFSPMYDENYALHQRSQMSALSLVRSGTKNVSRVNASYFAVEDRLAKKTQDIIKNLSKQTEELIFENKAGISRTELSKIGKEFDDYEKKLSAMVSKHDKSFLEARIKGTDTLYQKNAKQSYYQNQHQQRYDKWRQQQESIHGSQWYTTETGFTMGSNNAPYGEGQQLADKIHQAQKERADAEQKAAEQVREQFRKNAEQSRLLLTADAGIKKAKEETLNSEEELVEEKEQQVKAEKENTKKVKEMNEFQQNKVRVADDENRIRQDRNDILRADVERKAAKDNSGYSRYRNEHPELFSVGALYHSKRYQTGHMFQSLGGVASSLGSGGRAVGLALDSLGAFFKAVPFGIATTISNLAKGIVELGKASVQAYSEIEAIKTQLGVVFSNQTQADSMFGNISQYAIKSPFGVQQTSELAVLLKQSGVYASDLMDTLKMLGDTAGGNMEKMKRIANNYAQIVSIGKASMLDMRQFAYAGIPIFEAVSKELGVSQQELRKLISEGKVTADIVEKVFKDLTGINGIFENATEKGAKTLKARLQNLSDAKQLALGSLGERVVNAGTKNGNDGFILKFVTTAESFFSWMKDHNDIKNIERDVNTIATSDKRIAQLETLLKYAKDIKDKDLQKLIETELANQKALFDVDKQRAIYSESYDIKSRRYEEYKERFGYMSDREIMAAVEKYELTRDSIAEEKSKLADESRSRNLTSEEAVLLANYEDQVSIYDQLIKDLKDYAVAIEDVKTITEEETKAHRESELINKQQAAFDQAQKEAGKEGSYSSAFDKLYSLETSSAEYKQKKEQEELKFLKEAQEVLRKIADIVDENGNLDMTKLGYNEFSTLYNDKHAFDPSKKLTIVEGKSEAQMTADRAILEKQWNDMSDKIAKELSENGENLAVSRMGAARRMYSMEGGDNKTYFANFDLLLNHQLSILEELANENKGTDKEKEYQDMYNNLLASTFQLGVNTKGLNANPEDILSGNKNQFIPLWKRILAQYTGLSTLEMTTATDTMDKYRTDMAVRNMASNVMSATMKSMGIDSAMRLVSVDGAKQLKEDSSATLQVDWAKTRENLKNFSLALSASTDVVSAYKQSLEDELEVYQQLIIAGYTQGEDQNGGDSQFISVKKLAQYAQSNEQLVNAFGDTVETISGKKYNVDDLRFTQEGIFDKFGNKIDEQVKVTSSISRFIESILPKMYEDLHEADVAERRNETLEEAVQNIIGTELSASMLHSSGATNTTAYYINNQEKLYNDVLDAIKRDQSSNERKRLNDGTERFNEATGTIVKLSDEDILAKYLMASPERIRALEKEFKSTPDSSRRRGEIVQELGDLKIIKEYVDNIIKTTQKDLSALINSVDYKTIMAATAKKEKTEALTSDILKFGTYSDTQALLASATPNMYGGGRGLRNLALEMLTGGTMKYDKEDFYAAAARSGVIPGQTTNAFGLSEKSVKRANQDWNYAISMGASEKEATEFVVSKLDEADRKLISMKRSAEDWKNAMLEAGKALTDSFKQFGVDSMMAGTKAVAANLLDAVGYERELRDENGELVSTSSEFGRNMEKAGIAMLENVGAAMTTAGLNIAAGAALTQQWGLVAAGLGLAAAGGVVNGLGSILGEDPSKDKKSKSDNQIDKLNQLKDDLAKLLDQAKTDALYYERTLRHQTALGTNAEFSYKSVHDAVITSKGDVVTTDPRDYLIATKTPQQLVGGVGGITVSPVIHNTVINNTSAKVSQEKQVNQDGSINIVTMIEEATAAFIASPRSDDAFEARSYRMNGKQAVM